MECAQQSGHGVAGVPQPHARTRLLLIALCGYYAGHSCEQRGQRAAQLGVTQLSVSVDRVLLLCGGGSLTQLLLLLLGDRVNVLPHRSRQLRCQRFCAARGHEFSGRGGHAVSQVEVVGVGVSPLITVIQVEVRCSAEITITSSSMRVRRPTQDSD